MHPLSSATCGVSVRASSQLERERAAAQAANSQFCGAALTSESDPATNDVDEEHQLSSLTNNPAQDSLPDYAPTGAQLTFTSIRDGADRDIWVMGADGSAP